MLDKLVLSSKSNTLLSSLIELAGPVLPQEINSEAIIAWLKESYLAPAECPKEEYEFLRAGLTASLLEDLLLCLSDGQDIPQEDSNISCSKVWQIASLGIAGTLFAACQGFDSIVGMVSMLPIPVWAVLLIGIAFSILSVVVFYSFDLIQISQILGVKLSDTPKLLDTYLLQLNHLKAIRRKIATYNLTQLTDAQLAQLTQLLSMLQARTHALIQDGKQFDEALNSIPLRVAQVVFSGIGGLIFFAGGFFAGQSVAVFILGLFIASVSPTFWPVILFSIFVGLAGLYLYWYLEHNDSNNLISRWFGLDKETINELCDVPNLEKQEAKIEQLKNNVEGVGQLKHRFFQTKLESPVNTERFELQI